jgi:hypothetical protein
MSPDDYLGRDDLLALGLDEADVDLLLAETPLTGHGGEPVVEAGRLHDLLGLLGDADDGEDCT